MKASWGTVEPTRFREIPGDHPIDRQPTCHPPAQCSLKRGRTQARFRKKFLSDGMLQHKIL